jgi:hypothetical protein
MLSRLHFQRKLKQTLEALRNGSGSGVEFEQQRFLHRKLLALVLHLRCELLPPVCVREDTRAEKERVLHTHKTASPDVHTCVSVSVHLSVCVCACVCACHAKTARRET